MGARQSEQQTFALSRQMSIALPGERIELEELLHCTSTDTNTRLTPNEPAPFGINARGWVLLLCAAQVLLWSLAFGLTYSAPELDGAEQFVWSFSLENGYWKHPPMPSWIMHGLIQVFGASVALPFVATQISVVVALALTWRLGCEFMSARRSLIAMVLTSLVTYHNIGADCF